MQRDLKGEKIIDPRKDRGMNFKADVEGKKQNT